MKQRRKTGLDWNPCAGVELEPERPPEAKRWTAQEARRFIGATSGDPLGLMLRIAVLRGARRGELCGLRWADTDLDRGVLTVTGTVLQLLGKVVTGGRPKTRAGERRVYLGPQTAQLLREHRVVQEAEQQLAGEAWQDNGLVFCRPDGSLWPPDYVSKRFRKLAAAAGVPVIKLHEARHSAISLMRDAGVDREIRMREAGHADQAVADRYTHVLDAAHSAAAGDVEAFVLGGDGS